LGQHWDNLRLVADVLGVPERADEAERRYDAAVGRARVLGEGRTVSFGAVWEDGSLAVYEPDYYLAMRSAVELGFRLVPDFAGVGGKPGEGRIFLSAERVGELSGDCLILLQATNSADESAALEEVMNKPLFERLPAVEGGQVFVVSRLTAAGAAGVEGWLGLLDEMVPFSRGGEALEGGVARRQAPVACRRSRRSPAAEGCGMGGPSGGVPARARGLRRWRRDRAGRGLQRDPDVRARLGGD